MKAPAPVFALQPLERRHERTAYEPTPEPPEIVYARGVAMIAERDVEIARLRARVVRLEELLAIAVEQLQNAGRQIHCDADWFNTAEARADLADKEQA